MEYEVDLLTLLENGKNNYPKDFCQESNHEMDNSILYDIDPFRLKVRTRFNPMAIMETSDSTPKWRNAVIIFFDDYEDKEKWCHLSEEIYAMILESIEENKGKLIDKQPIIERNKGE
jgi:hypothetical protein